MDPTEDSPEPGREALDTAAAAAAAAAAVAVVRAGGGNNVLFLEGQRRQ